MLTQAVREQNDSFPKKEFFVALNEQLEMLPRDLGGTEVRMLRDDGHVETITVAGIDTAGTQQPSPAPRRAAPKPGRNEPCPCGSGKKYKKCHGAA